jgi:hypothetical protein
MYDREYLRVQPAGKDNRGPVSLAWLVTYQMYARYSTMTMMRQRTALFKRKAAMKAIAMLPRSMMVATTRTGLNICLVVRWKKMGRR